MLQEVSEKATLFTLNDIFVCLTKMKLVENGREGITQGYFVDDTQWQVGCTYQVRIGNRQNLLKIIECVVCSFNTNNVFFEIIETWK